MTLPCLKMPTLPSVYQCDPQSVDFPVQDPSMTLSYVLVANSQGEALSHPEWWQVMIDEIYALQSSGTW